MVCVCVCARTHARVRVHVCVYVRAALAVRASLYSQHHETVVIWYCHQLTPNIELVSGLGQASVSPAVKKWNDETCLSYLFSHRTAGRVK